VETAIWLNELALQLTTTITTMTTKNMKMKLPALQQ
jgi:hypothetical protein